MLNAKLEKMISDLFNKYVPLSGKCDTVGGEIVRAYNRIAYRFYNDGDMVSEGYGRETVNPSARYLLANVEGAEQFFEIERYGNEIYPKCYLTSSEYEDFLNKLGFFLISYLDKKPELFTISNEEDMFAYAEDCDVDNTDDYEDEEDEDY